MYAGFFHLLCTRSITISIWKKTEQQKNYITFVLRECVYNRGHILLYLSLSTNRCVHVHGVYVFDAVFCLFSWGFMWADCIFTVLFGPKFAFGGYVRFWLCVCVRARCTFAVKRVHLVDFLLVLMKTKLRCVKKFCTINFIYCSLPFRLSFVTLISCLIHSHLTQLLTCSSTWFTFDAMCGDLFFCVSLSIASLGSISRCVGYVYKKKICFYLKIDSICGCC